jgi:hypothetical protein
VAGVSGPQSVALMSWLSVLMDGLFGASRLTH